MILIFEIFQFGFIQRALISGIAVAVSCSTIGLFLVLRRQSLYGDALSHVAFGGIAVGLFTNIYPIWTAFAVSILASLGMTKLRESTKIPSDSAVAVLLSAGLALGVVLIGLSGGFSLDLYSFLFGSILLISYNDQLLIVILSFIILTIMYKMHRKFIYIAFDEEQAKVSGLNVTKLNYLFIVLAGLTVITSVRLVGVLLISSLIVIPNITAMMLGKGFKKTLLMSIFIAIVSVIGGILISYVMNLAPGGTIVIISVGIFLTVICIKHSFKVIKEKDRQTKQTSQKN
jgi:zinc transport system permease protein